MSELAEELADLMGALRDAAAEHTEVTDTLRRIADQPGHAAECRACPVCQGLALLRQTRPEAFEHLAVAVDALALAARALRSPRAATDRTTPADPQAPPVERIDIE